jgi:hypothetical protein
MSYNWIREFGNRDIPALFNIKGDHLPTNGLPVRVVQGVPMWVEPSAPPRNGRKSSKHRAMCACPKCGKVVSIGRLHQHVKIHQVRSA